MKTQLFIDNLSSSISQKITTVLYDWGILAELSLTHSSMKRF